ncbi:MAG: ribose-phosphate pyrophosphokinase [Nitrososphaerota archaeon]|jgi:ribose-phosphate pyrophosphokinase|nr:ribose-phosphate pyrophosphokinase [Nitrososphaerota archaeon]
MKIVLGPASRELAEGVLKVIGCQGVSVVLRVFPDGESYVRLEGDVLGEDIVIVQTTCPPMQDSKLFQLVFMADAAKRAGANRVTAVVPYFAYARQDKLFLSGEGISVETIVRMLGASGIDDLITVNIHSEQVLSRFSFPVKTVSAISLLADYFVDRGYRGAYALAPDKGATYIAKEAQQVLGGGVGHLSKVRDRYTGQTAQSGEGLDVEGQTVVIFDDIISTGGTIVGAAKILKDLGAKHVFAACVHPLLIGDAAKRMLDAGVKEIIGTDSVPGPYSKVSLSPLISEQLKGAI